ncbi:MAG: response regulator [Lachnospiraceae bacterium]|nr:response regulator [Lachnospiraceae bacterium]
MSNRLPNVLIVDDDMQTLETMSLYLKGTARVSTVLGGRQALEYVQQYPVDIILLDVEMPIMDGFVTLEQLRKIEECINVPIILVTSKRDKYTVLNSCIMGVDGYLAKPVSKDMLIQKISEVYQNHEEQDNRKTVLLIDDDMSYLKQVNNFLQDSYNVIMINSAKLALNYLLKHTPDIIVLDYQMPLYNGANVMNMIQKNTPEKHIPVIILSGALNREVLEECYSYNPAAYLAKPVSKEALLENIERVLSK